MARSIPELLSRADAALDGKDCATAWASLDQSWKWLIQMREGLKSGGSFDRKAQLEKARRAHVRVADRYRKLCKGKKVSRQRAAAASLTSREAKGYAPAVVDADTMPVGDAPKYRGDRHGQAVDVRGFRDAMFKVKKRDEITGEEIEFMVPVLDSETSAGAWMWVALGTGGVPLPRSQHHWRWVPPNKPTGQVPRARVIMAKRVARKLEQAQQLVCPQCKACVGARCTADAGAEMKTAVHDAREEAAARLAKAPPKDAPPSAREVSATEALVERFVVQAKQHMKKGRGARKPRKPRKPRR